MKIVVLGATGNSGKAIIKEALARSHHVTLYARSPSKLDVSLKSHPNVIVLQGRMDDETALRQAFRGHDAVVSVIGPTPQQPHDHVITDAYKNIFSAMKAEHITRFVGTGTPSYRDPRDRFQFSLWLVVCLISVVLPWVYRDVVSYSTLVADEKDIEWSWFRLMLVNDKPKTGKVVHGYSGDGHLSFGFIRRDDLAELMLDEITERRWVRQMPIIRTA